LGVQREAASLLVLGLLSSCAALWKGDVWQKELKQRRDAVVRARKAWEHATSAWRNDGKQLGQTFRTRREQMEALVAEFKALPNALQKEKQDLTAQRQGLQRKAFLERKYVSAAHLDGIGPTLKAVLASYGVETAADVGPDLYRIPGFGPRRVATVMAWRSLIESQFRFDPTKSVDPKEIAAVTHRFTLRAKEIARLMREGQRELEHISKQAHLLGPGSISRYTQMAQALAQAKADLRVMTRG
jgi:DNA-binding helix-hairpin-helix protein with protein kinase domain